MYTLTLDRKGLLELARTLATNTLNLKKLIDEMQDRNKLLMEALGENDYRSIQHKVMDMQMDYDLVNQNMTAVLAYLDEYIENVGKLELLLHPDGSVTKKA